MAAGIDKPTTDLQGRPCGDDAQAGVSVFMLPSDLPVSLSPLDLEILARAFQSQPSGSTWCGFTILEQKRTRVRQGNRARAVIFITGGRCDHLIVARHLDGSYALYDTDNQVVRSATCLFRLMRIFRRREHALN